MSSSAGDAFQVPVHGSVAVTCLLHTCPQGVSPTCRLIYAPGAGSTLDDPFGAFLGERLPPRGVELLRFQFPYMEVARRVPDRMPVLEETWNAIIDAGMVSESRIVIGGRSMGGRIASYVAAKDRPVDGLALFAYPLHPPGQPEKRRDGHLSLIATRTLFCSGTRDTFATPEELRDLVEGLPGASLYLLAGADHGYQVLKSSGRTRELVWIEAAEAFLSWTAASE